MRSLQAPLIYMIEPGFVAKPLNQTQVRCPQREEQHAFRHGHDLPAEYLPAEAGEAGGTAQAGERAPMLNTRNAKPYQRHCLGNQRG